MSFRLNDLVHFRGERLFDGAVDVEWFIGDPSKCQMAATSYVFHGPSYHGVTQDDIGKDHGHKLIDTAQFFRSIVRGCCGIEDQAFNLAIAGYGTGKSHLAITLAALLSSPESHTAQEVLANIEAADSQIGGEIRAILSEDHRPCLVVTLNGMGNYDLAAEFTRQVIHQLQRHNIDTKAIDDLRPRFKHAASLLNLSNDQDIAGLVLDCNVHDRNAIIEKLQEHDENTYAKVHAFYAEKGIPLKAIGDETVKDVIETVCSIYCGEGNPFKHFLILFDEFGRYAEFATERSQIAGSGVLQHLFEGVQSNTSHAMFVGFIQFELNAYVQRIAPEYKNEILRVSTRYQIANKSYLSINLETLIANLIEKVDGKKLVRCFDSEEEKAISSEMAKRLRNWFPLASNHQLWIDDKKFHSVIRKGCWPLSPFSVWFLFHLAAAGHHLQQRSVLSLLSDIFRRYQGYEILEIGSWQLTPVDLWSDNLEEELRASEESGGLGTLTHSFLSAVLRYGQQLEEDAIRVLKAIVLSAKMRLSASGKEDAIKALAELSGIEDQKVIRLIEQLETDYNIIAWDPSSKLFDILVDAVSRTQFLAFLNQRVASSYDERAKSHLFVRKAAVWSDVLSAPDCDFAETHHITTQEWRFESVSSNLENLQIVLLSASQRWDQAITVDGIRGTVVFCYVEPNRDPQVVKADVIKKLRDVAKPYGLSALPILVILLFDDGQLGKVLAELAVIEEGFNEQDRARFGNLVKAHEEKLRQILSSQLDRLIKERNYIVGFKDPLQAQRLKSACSEIFERIYTEPLAFPFDGYSTARGNAADTCQQLITDLLRGALDFQAVTSKPIKDKNRAVQVLKQTWQIYSPKTGEVARQPSNKVVRAIINSWERSVKDGPDGMNVANAIRNICRPPYGANLASAGLLFGVFLSPRLREITIRSNGREIDITNLLNDGIFHGKHIDLSKLSRVEITLAGPGSSEWETLLDDWEQTIYYQERLEFYKRAIDLTSRISIPHSLTYKFDRLKDLAEDASNKIETKKKRIEDAFEKIEKGHSKLDAGMISWGGSILKKLQEEMETNESWKSEDSRDLDKDIQFARQATIQAFPHWLPSQVLVNDSPSAVGKYEHQMLRVIGSNLKQLGLDQEFEQLKEHVSQVVKKANTYAEACQLIRDVDSWISSHDNQGHLIRIAEIRGQRDIAKDFSNKLIGMSKRIALPEINTMRTKLATFMEQLREREKGATKRAEKLWNTRLDINTLDQVLDEVQDLELMFEGCDNDIADLRMMRRSLRLYQDCYRQLNLESLSQKDFDALSENLRDKAIKELADDEPPWPPDEIINSFVRDIRKIRTSKGEEWLKSIEDSFINLGGMGVSEANNLREKIQSYPPYINEKQIKLVVSYIEKIENHLMRLEIEWLVEKFSKLSIEAKKEFLRRIND